MPVRKRPVSKKKEEEEEPAPLVGAELLAKHPWLREELEKLRATVDASEEEASEVGGPVQAAGDFVEDIKAGEAAAPTVEDTIPGGDN